MPIRIADHLPATRILESENIFVMTENRAMHQDIRPLQILILNLMPTSCCGCWGTRRCRWTSI